MDLESTSHSRRRSSSISTSHTSDPWKLLIGIVSIVMLVFGVFLAICGIIVMSAGGAQHLISGFANLTVGLIVAASGGMGVRTYRRQTEGAAHTFFRLMVALAIGYLIIGIIGITIAMLTKSACVPGFPDPDKSTCHHLSPGVLITMTVVILFAVAVCVSAAFCGYQWERTLRPHRVTKVPFEEARQVFESVEKPGGYAPMEDVSSVSM